MDQKLLALEKTPPQTGNRQLTRNIEGWHKYFIAATDTRYETRKRPLVSEKPPATPSSVNSLFPEKMIMDLRNGKTCAVLMGFGWNLVVRSLIEFCTHIWKFDPG